MKPQQWAEDKVWAWLLEARRSKGWKVLSLKLRGGKEDSEGWRLGEAPPLPDVNILRS